MNLFRFVFVSSTSDSRRRLCAACEQRKEKFFYQTRFTGRAVNFRRRIRRRPMDRADVLAWSHVTRRRRRFLLFRFWRFFFSSIIRTLFRLVEFSSEIRTYTLKHVWKIYTRARARRSQRIRGATIASASHRVPSTTTGGCQKQLLLPTTTAAVAVAAGEHARHAVTANGGGNGNGHPVKGFDEGGNGDRPHPKALFTLLSG